MLKQSKNKFHNVPRATDILGNITKCRNHKAQEAS